MLRAAQQNKSSWSCTNDVWMKYAAIQVPLSKNRRSETRHPNESGDVESHTVSGGGLCVAYVYIEY